MKRIASLGRRRGPLLAALAVFAAVAGAALAAGLLGSSDGSQPRAAPEELRLDQVKPAPAPRRQEPAARSRAKVVKAVPPGGALPSATGADGAEQDEEPPPRILAENARLRKEVDHLKALEAERRRVSRALARAGARFSGPLQLGRSGLAWPVGGSVISPFGQRWGRLHAGVDIVARTGDVIRAAADGLVVINGPTGGYGNYVCVQHTRRLTTCYAHLSRFLTERGAMVRQGEPIGLVGCTGHCFGDHLHFETWVSGRPVDPMRFY